MFDGGPQDYNNFRADRGNSSGDARHSGSFNLLYALPVGYGRRFLANSNGFLDRIIGGWEIAGLGQFRSGIASTVYIPISQTGNFDTINQRPDVVPGVSIYPVDQNINHWLNPAAFSVPAVGTFGNSSRGVFYGPGLNNIDFSAIKNTMITESVKLQLRAEIFNILNHPNFGQPGSTLGTSGFGVVFNTLGRTTGFGTSRQIQLSGRINF